MAVDAESPALDGSLLSELFTSVSEHRRLFLIVFLLTAFVCAGFASLSALMVLAGFIFENFHEEEGFRSRLLLKGILFALCALASAWGVRRLNTHEILEPARPPEESKKGLWLLAAVCLLASMLILPHLQTFPWAAPDEVHHLVVAKNLYEHGAYASGHPESGLKYFDSYDSVGPPVIAGIAGLFKITGLSIGTARLWIAFSCLFLCLAVYVLYRPIFGGFGAVISVLMMFMAIDTIYLARTVYGELPALLFLIAGLILWSHSLEGRRVAITAVSAGALFGLAVMTKTFIAVSAWAFLAVWLYDYFTFRKITLKHVLYPGLGMVFVFLPWILLKGRFAESIQEELPIVIYYRHSLLFGFDSVSSGLTWFWKNLPDVLAAIISVVWLVPALFRDRYSPAVIVLFLMALEFVFWWIFFTPGHIPRYLWYSMAIFAMLSGPLLERCLKGLRGGSLLSRIICVSILILCVGPGVGRIVDKTGKVYGTSEMASDLEVAEYVSGLPQDARIATTYWPLEKSLNFLANRYVPYIDGRDSTLGEFDTVLWDAEASSTPIQVLKVEHRIGRYIVVSLHDPEGGN